MSAKPQPVQYGDRQVYSVAGFNHGVGGWLQRLPEVWVDGEVAEMKQQSGWTYAYLTLKDPGDGSSLQALVARSRLEAIQPPLRPGDRVHLEAGVLGAIDCGIVQPDALVPFA